MATIPLTIPDAWVAKFRTNLGQHWGYQANIPDPGDPTSTIPNPETLNQFIVRMIKFELVQHVKNIEIENRQVAEREQARIDADAEFVG